MTHREKALFRQTLDMLRKERTKPGQDWKDVDDYIFSELDLTQEDIAAIYGQDAFVYTASAIEGFAPAELTYDEIKQYVSVSCRCVEIETPLYGAKNLVIQADIPGNPILLTNGEVPETLEAHVGKEFIVGINQDHSICIRSLGGSVVLYRWKKEGGK